MEKVLLLDQLLASAPDISLCMHATRLCAPPVCVTPSGNQLSTASVTVAAPPVLRAVATEKPRLLTTADGRGALTSTLGTLEQCQQPLSANPSGLLLVPDAPGAGGDGTVVWNVIRMCLGSRNTCNVKSVLTRST